MCNMTAQELITELRKCPKYWTVAYDYERHYIFYIHTIINNYNKSIILSCDLGNTNILTVRQFNNSNTLLLVLNTLSKVSPFAVNIIIPTWSKFCLIYLQKY